ncbi:hypothetical protein ADK57_27595 [Streptomyces sp. MMG1533]|uniref:hypothetical protein n=1 Tax=Streptomyces sp. MMG1533 TaxID=1415546 RepID=UPI0006ADA9FE|nr:hypothetical protein [Streptomyces sp. MMG1533]KOU61518.1 hypothetical protein ADK57_27595 [Streptomyces sp. MMG1533]
MNDSAGPPGGDGPRPQGGHVLQTGIALVRRDEMVVPLEGSEAELALAEQDARQDIHIHLPVTVEVVGAVDSLAVRTAVDDALRRVRHAMDAHTVQG